MSPRRASSHSTCVCVQTPDGSRWFGPRYQWRRSCQTTSRRPFGATERFGWRVWVISSWIGALRFRRAGSDQTAPPSVERWKYTSMSLWMKWSTGVTVLLWDFGTSPLP